MSILSNEMLLDSYYKAIELSLEDAFIALLRTEISRRNLDETQVEKAH